MAAGQQNSGIDLERELTCSICTDVLYQPLTLLDCLHTFCGSCLKEWFKFQARSGDPSSLTCPSCRAIVRGTKPNATVTTLLEMFLTANPGRGKTAEEKEEIAKVYKHGEEVLPKIESRRRRRASNSAAEDEDRRIMDEVRQLSLQEVGIPSGGADANRERRRRERSRDPRDPGQRSRTADGRATSRTRSHRPEARRDRSRDERVAQETRRVEHQSSLRSLLSASDLDNQEMQEEIMRQIMEEGLLDGIDWDNLDEAQEDEITERIAQAYQRRQREREGEGREVTRPRQTERASRSTPPSPRLAPQDSPTRRRTHAGSENRPPISRPHLLGAPSDRDRDRQNHRRRSSAGSSQRGPRPTNNPELTDHSSRQAARSATDLSERPQTQEAAERRRRMSQSERRSTDPERRPSTLAPTSRSNSNSQNTSNPNSPRTATFSSNATTTRPSGTLSSSNSRSSRPSGRRGSNSSTRPRPERPSNNSTPALGAAPTSLEPQPQENRPASSSAAIPSTARPALFTEPSISCNRCGAQHIEYDVHYNCPKCKEGKYNICMSCYRADKGCLHWFGFGFGAQRKFDARGPHPPGTEQPHILTGHRYLKPKVEPTQVTTHNTSQRLTDEDPSKRLEAGVFCAKCNSFANACYWHCDTCNEGEWGFCNSCVNKGVHCTHALLPLKQTSKQIDNPEEPAPLQLLTSSSPPPEALPQAASILHGPVAYVPLANTLFTPLTFSTRCDICRYPIPPTYTRYHCGTCNNGDYDICNSCYASLVLKGHISAENGQNGWRKCPRGHRMCVVGFEDRAEGRLRVVVRDIVGGRQFEEDTAPAATASPAAAAPAVATSPETSTPTGGNPAWRWREEDGTWNSPSSMRNNTSSGAAMASAPLPPVTSARFPPDGGRGMKVMALYSYWPGEEVKDELAFPKFAEMREVIDINGDWFFGVYCGEKGLFPGNYARIIG